jgi:hypothetical protein
MKIKVNELEGVALDWAVAKCEVWPLELWFDDAGHPIIREDLEVTEWNPSGDWSQGGPIIERERIDLYGSGGWVAEYVVTGAIVFAEGPTPLVAAMRCYVENTLGDEIEVPDQLV